MAGIVKCAHIQLSNATHEGSPAEIKEAMIEKHIPFIEKAGEKGVRILCLQEIFHGPYFCCEQDIKWYRTAEKVPGPITGRMSEYAKKYRMVMVVPVYEEALDGVYYNTAAVLDADGTYLGKFRKIHLPHTWPGFWEKFYFKPGNLGFPVFETAYAKIGIFLCYDRHFPECARILALNGAEILFNPSATTAGLSKYLWELEQPAQAAANGVFIGANNRVGLEKPWEFGRFYGSSYFADPRGQIVAKGSEYDDELVIADLDLNEIREVRDGWQFFRDRRPEMYEDIRRHLP
ncbi:Acyltransferase [Candidatus Desulfarcum epimagneticum]|uniref:Acyltransferase n=1 Tax=uncultured Desulfobacteraceae bacterium TaxID=218296 RepID=A0A484HFM6_9BACT|nr:Acyltransferase [uncultured Desulfobacteraceae bacterium]